LRPVVVVTDRFPELSETFVIAEIEALRALGHPVRVEARMPPGQTAGAPTGLEVRLYGHEGTRGGNIRALAVLAARHPLGCLRDLLARARWRREETVTPLRRLAPLALGLRAAEHVHVHFAAEAALDAMRAASIAGVPYSVTAHAYEIFMSPANLREKLERARFATTGCRYNVEQLERVAPGARLHEIVMGVDGDRFRRSTPYGRGGRVLAVGRLIEKKGFAYLVEAAGRTPGLERLTIVGTGPLERELRALAGDRVELAGPRSPDEVRGLLEDTDVLAMPCVVAADGDRDSMPVAVKEALAMEVPVVATDEVGLPELVRPEWGRLVPPRDAGALAGAMAELLALPVEQRAAMGRAGRRHVLAHADVRTETTKLSGLIAGAAR
jgi:glycosyltransferase involved in cell wall biosynthesis